MTIPDPGSLPLLSAFFRNELGDSASVDRTIHSNDEMLQPAGDPDQQDLEHFLIHYFRSGFSMYSTIEQIVRWRFGGFDRVKGLLDFASGYGRLTRFLIPKLGRERIAVSEINVEAVEFQVQQFGVEGIISVTDPAEFKYDKKFDVIFAASLFTHLPRQTFGAWFERLWSLLNPGGVFIFSVHGEQTFNWTGKGQADGDFVYDASPQSAYLDPQEYGNTYVSDAFLREVIGDRSFIRLRRGLMNFQDLCIVVPERDADFSMLNYDSGADGRLDLVTIAADGSVHLWGWAASRHAPVEHIEILLGDKLLGSAKPMYHRGDVEAFYREPSYLWSGWEFSIKASELTFSFDDILTVRAVTRSLKSVLFIGSLGTAAFRSKYGAWVRGLRDHLVAQLKEAVLLRTQAEERAAHFQQQAEARTAEASDLRYQKHLLEQRIEAMEASRFWKMRNQWFRIKRFMRITNEP